MTALRFQKIVWGFEDGGKYPGRGRCVLEKFGWDCDAKGTTEKLGKFGWDCDAKGTTEKLEKFGWNCDARGTTEKLEKFGWDEG